MAKKSNTVCNLVIVFGLLDQMTCFSDFSNLLLTIMDHNMSHAITLLYFLKKMSCIAEKHDFLSKISSVQQYLASILLPYHIFPLNCWNYLTMFFVFSE